MDFYAALGSGLRDFRVDFFWRAGKGGEKGAEAPQRRHRSATMLDIRKAMQCSLCIACLSHKQVSHLDWRRLPEWLRPAEWPLCPARRCIGGVDMDQRIVEPAITQEFRTTCMVQGSVDMLALNNNLN
jgi:hypothetical protein